MSDKEFRNRLLEAAAYVDTWPIWKKTFVEQSQSLRPIIEGERYREPDEEKPQDKSR